MTLEVRVELARIGIRGPSEEVGRTSFVLYLEDCGPCFKNHTRGNQSFKVRLMSSAVFVS